MGYAISLDRLINWLHVAQPNEKMVYYTGETLAASVLTRELRKQVYNLATMGAVYLVQKRLNGDLKGNTDFIAIKASPRPIHKLVPLSDEQLNNVRKAVYHGVDIP